MRLYRAVSEAEREDIVASGGFRLDPDSFGFGKWFALNEQNAISWSRWFASHDNLTYYIVEAEVDDTAVQQLHVTENLDNIGPAVSVEDVHLPDLTVVTSQALLLDGSGSFVSVQLAPKALLGE